MNRKNGTSFKGQNNERGENLSNSNTQALHIIKILNWIQTRIKIAAGKIILVSNSNGNENHELNYSYLNWKPEGICRKNWEGLDCNISRSKIKWINDVKTKHGRVQTELEIRREKFKCMKIHGEIQEAWEKKLQEEKEVIKHNSILDKRNYNIKKYEIKNK